MTRNARAQFQSPDPNLATVQNYLRSLDWSKFSATPKIRTAYNCCPLQERTGLRYRYTTRASDDTGLSWAYLSTVVWCAADNILLDHPEVARLRRWMLDRVRRAKRPGQIRLPLS